MARDCAHRIGDFEIDFHTPQGRLQRLHVHHHTGHNERREELTTLWILGRDNEDLYALRFFTLPLKRGYNGADRA